MSQRTPIAWSKLLKGLLWILLIIGISDLLRGIVLFWEVYETNLVWYGAVLFFIGTLFIVLAYLVNQQSISILWLTIPLLLARSIFSDVLLRLAQDKNISLAGLFITFACINLVWVNLKQSQQN